MLEDESMVGHGTDESAVSATSNGFAVTQVDAAIRHVIVHGAENDGAKTYYTLVFGEGGMAAPQHLHQVGNRTWSHSSWKPSTDAASSRVFRPSTPWLSMWRVHGAVSRAPATSASTDSQTHSVTKPHQSAPQRQPGSGKRKWTSVVPGASAAAEDMHS
jgi:hypothetical protein